MIRPTAQQLVAAGQCLLPLYPAPSNEAIDEILTKLIGAFPVAFTVENDARQLWRARVKKLQAA